MSDHSGIAKLRALAAQSQPHKASLPISEPHARALADLASTDPEDVITILSPILALVGAAGMSQDDRREWLAAATDALQHIPHDLLSAAAASAKQACDHPSKVIPFIIRETEASIAFRRRALADWEQRYREHYALPAPGESRCTGQEAAEIIDKECPWVRQGQEAPVKVHRGPPRMPTRADYIALGVDPAVLDQIEQDRAA